MPVGAAKSFNGSYFCYVNAGPMKPRTFTEELDTDEETDQCECHERDSSYTCDYCKRKGLYGHMEKR